MNRTKLYFSLTALILAAVLAVSACNSTEEPGEVVEKFMSHYNKGEFEEAEKYLTSSAAETFSPPGEDSKVAKKMAERVDVEINGENAEEGEERVYLSGTLAVPDLEELTPGFLEKSLSVNRQDLEKLFMEELDRVSDREISFEEEVVLVEEEGKLKIEKAPFLELKTMDITGAAAKLLSLQEDNVDFYLGDKDFAGSRVRELVASKMGPEVTVEGNVVHISTSHPDPNELNREFKRIMDNEVSHAELFRSRGEKEEYVAGKLYDAVKEAIDKVSFDSSRETLEVTSNGGLMPKDLFSGVSGAVSELGPPDYKPDSPGSPENPLTFNERNYLWPVSGDLDKLAAWEREGQFAFSGRPSPTPAIIHEDTVFYTYLNDGEFTLEGTDINSGEKVFSDVFLRQERFGGMPPQLVKYKGMLVMSYKGGPEGPEFYHPSRGVVAYDLDTMEEVYHVKFDGKGTVTLEGDYIYKINPGPLGEVEEYTPEKYSLETGEKIWGKELSFSSGYNYFPGPEITGDFLIYSKNRGEKGDVVVLDKNTGEKLFHETETRPLGFYEDKLLLQSGGDYFIYDAESGSRGEISWLKDIAGDIEDNDRIELASGDVIAVDNGEGITAFERESGEELWEKGEFENSRFNKNEGLLTLVKKGEDTYVFVDARTGEIKQEQRGKFISGRDKNEIYMYYKNVIKQIDGTTGEKNWEYEHEEEIEEQPRFINFETREDTMLFRAGDILAGVDRKTGEVQFQYHITGVSPYDAGSGYLAANSEAAVVSNLNSLFMTLSQ